MAKFTDGLMSLGLWGSGVRILPGTGLNAMKKVTQGMFDMVRSNADFADYLVSEKGIQQWIKHADGQDAKMAAHQIESGLSHILSATTRVKQIKGGEWTGKYVLKLDPVKLGISSAVGVVGSKLNPDQERTYVSRMLDQFFGEEEQGDYGRYPQSENIESMGDIQTVQNKSKDRELSDFANQQASGLDFMQRGDIETNGDRTKGLDLQRDAENILGPSIDEIMKRGKK
jgi:hypothetical protein